MKLEYKKYKDNAFTIVELSIVFAIMGVLMVVGIHTMNNTFSDYHSRYYTAKAALEKAAYNISIDFGCDQNLTDTLKDCTPDDGSSDDSPNCKEDALNGCSKCGRTFPDADCTSGSMAKASKLLCKRLIEYINTPDETTCDNAEELSDDELATFAFYGKTKDEHEKDKKKVQFVATNGFKFYISGIHNNDSNKLGCYKKDNVVSLSCDPKDENTSFKYFIVYVDLNGNSGPNIINTKGKGRATDIRPDIVPFIVTTQGNVIPAGYPIYDKSYITARIINSGGNDGNGLEAGDNKKYQQSESFTLDEARQIAFGHVNEYKDLAYSIDTKRLISTNILPAGQEDDGYNIRCLGDVGLKEVDSCPSANSNGLDNEHICLKSTGLVGGASICIKEIDGKQVEEEGYNQFGCSYEGQPSCRIVIDKAADRRTK